ncbi:hypothetical protein M0811_00622 [Anaeramoeba ignava]|uniref:Uncharacterized protein n=1 Tax=Anaeramoeba ignava TaxID=1746090 RepID=A0A9Q0LQV2_ANAIG|nr:hypothetical protein M0811_00622 [Anaeramoeba ignava]
MNYWLLAYLEWTIGKQYCFKKIFYFPLYKTLICPFMGLHDYDAALNLKEILFYESHLLISSSDSRMFYRMIEMDYWIADLMILIIACGVANSRWEIIPSMKQRISFSGLFTVFDSKLPRRSRNLNQAFLFLF